MFQVLEDRIRVADVKEERFKKEEQEVHNIQVWFNVNNTYINGSNYSFEVTCTIWVARIMDTELDLKVFEY